MKNSYKILFFLLLCYSSSSLSSCKNKSLLSPEHRGTASIFDGKTILKQFFLHALITGSARLLNLIFILPLKEKMNAIVLNALPVEEKTFGYKTLDTTNDILETSIEVLEKEESNSSCERLLLKLTKAADAYKNKSNCKIFFSSLLRDVFSPDSLSSFSLIYIIGPAAIKILPTKYSSPILELGARLKKFIQSPLGMLIDALYIAAAPYLRHHFKKSTIYENYCFEKYEDHRYKKEVLANNIRYTKYKYIKQSLYVITSMLITNLDLSLRNSLSI